MYDDPSDDVPEVRGAVEVLQRIEQEKLMVLLLFAPELVKCRTQVLNRPFCGELREEIYHLRERRGRRKKSKTFESCKNIANC